MIDTDFDYMDLPVPEQPRRQVETLEATPVEKLAELAAHLRGIAAGEGGSTLSERATSALFATAIDNRLATGQDWHPDILHVVRVIDAHNRGAGFDLLPALFALTESEA